MNHQQKESKIKGKNPSQLSNLMLQRDKNKIQNKNKNLEILRKPRNQEYLRLLDVVTNLSLEIGEVEEKIEKATKNLTVLQEGKKEKWWEIEITKKEVSEKKISEAESELFKLKQRHQSLLEEFKYATEQFIAQIPAPERMLGFIYPYWNEKLLLKYGILSYPGESFTTQEELLDLVQPKTQKEEEQWCKALREFHKNVGDTLLLTEVYMDMVCVVFKNGEVIVVE